jgi:hypothetical protein
MSRWSILLAAAWCALALGIGVALARGVSLRDDLSMPTVFLFVLTMLAGSRVWSALFRAGATNPQT